MTEPECPVTGKEKEAAVKLYELSFNSDIHRPLAVRTVCDDVGIERERLLDAYNEYMTWVNSYD